MNCTDAKARLENASAASEIAADKTLCAHLQVCEQCRDYAQELRLNRLLGEMPVPPVSEGFADRAFTRAWDTAHNRPAKATTPLRYGVMGLAASILMAVVLVTQFGPRDESEVSPEYQVVQLEPHIMKPVTVRLVSKEALPEATITIRLAGDVALVGYPGSDTLSWQTSIAAGSNHLSLPVALLGEESGVIAIEVRSGNARKHMQVSVRPTLPATAQLHNADLHGPGSQFAI